MANPVPEGYQTLTPFLSIDEAANAIEFYKRAFGAQERGVMKTPDGKIAHAALQIGNSMLMLSDMFPGISTGKTPREVDGTTVDLFLYVEDVDEVFKQAVDAGATSMQEPEDQFWGDRWGRVTDPFGHVWQIATHVEDVSDDELARRAQEAMAAMS